MFFLICLLNLLRLKKHHSLTKIQQTTRHKFDLLFLNNSESVFILVCHYSFQIEKKTTFLQVSYSLEKNALKRQKKPIQILKNASDVGQNILSTKKIILQCWLFSHQMCVLPIDLQHSFVQFNSSSHVCVR